MIGIYKITSPTNKIYIGQSTDIEKRWKDYFKLSRCKSQTKLYNSLKNHGYQNHKFEVIEECSVDKLIERETYWKEYYKVLEIPSLCCRLDGKGGKDSDETKQNKRLGALGSIKLNNRKPKPEGFGELISKLKKGKPNFKNRGPRSKKFGELISKAKKGKPNPKNAIPKPSLRIAVLQYDMQNNLIKEHSSLSEACLYINKPINKAGYISRACKGIRNTAFKYVWKYKEPLPAQ